MRVHMSLKFSNTLYTPALKFYKYFGLMMACLGLNYSPIFKLIKYNTVVFDEVYILLYFNNTFVNCNWVDTRWQYYSTHLHTNNTLWLEDFLGFEPRVVKLKLTMNWPRKNYRLTGNSAGRAPFLRVIPWHLPYNWGKNTAKNLSLNSRRMQVNLILHTTAMFSITKANVQMWHAMRYLGSHIGKQTSVTAASLFP
jgi:hypothetical protein